MANPSSQSTSSALSTRTYYVPSTGRLSTLPDCAAQTSSLCSPISHPRPCPDTSRVCATSASLDVSAEPIATISPVSAEPPSQPAATSPKTFSFPLSHDKIFAQNVKNRFTRAYATPWSSPHRQILTVRPAGDLRLD